MHADSRSKKNVGGSRLDLVGQVLTNLIEKILVPCCSQRNATWEEGRLRLSAMRAVAMKGDPDSPWCLRRRYLRERHSGHHWFSRRGCSYREWPLSSRSLPP